MKTVQTLAELQDLKVRGTDAFSEPVICEELRAVFQYRDFVTSAPTADNVNAIATGDGGQTRWMRQRGESFAYTPAAVASTDSNVSASSFSAARATISGKVVTVEGKASITPTAGSSTSTYISITLPIACNLTAAGQLTGVMTLDSGTDCTAGIVTTDTTNDAAKLSFYAGGTGAHTISYSFSYTID